MAGKFNYCEYIDLDIDSVRYDVPMKEHTSFKLGGTADIFCEPRNVEEIIATLKCLREHNIPYYLIGNGSNLLVSDKGIRGAVVKIADNFTKVQLEGELLIAECGILLSTISKLAAKNTLTGLEFASGIPGTLGGGIAMNAGAYGGEMKDIIEWVEVLDEELRPIRLSNAEMNFSYRHSIVQDKGYIVTKCAMKLQYGEQDKINEQMSDLTQKRKTKQPLHLPSAGSTFKRPEGYFAGKLIEDSELRGCKLGGAQVSDLHCGFVVNNGDATAEDVYNLIRHVQNTVYEKFNVRLETEVKLLGEF